MVRLNHPILSNTQLDILCNIRYKGFKTVKLPMLFEVSKRKAGLQEALNRLCKMAEESVTEGVNYIVLTDREVDATHAVIPSLLAVSAVQCFLQAGFSFRYLKQHRQFHSLETLVADIAENIQLCVA